MNYLYFWLFGVSPIILKPAPSELLQDGLKVNIIAKIRDDVISMAMIGDIIEVLGFQVL